MFSLPIPVRLCSDQGMSLTNDELEQQLIQLADALAKATEMTATALEERDQQIQNLREKIETLKSQLKTDD
jgi:cytochrome c553